MFREGSDPVAGESCCRPQDHHRSLRGHQVLLRPEQGFLLSFLCRVSLLSNLIARLQNKDASQNYLRVVEKTELSHTLAPLLGLVILRLSTHEKEAFEKSRASFIDYYVKIVLSSKTIPPRHIIVCPPLLDLMLQYF